MITINCKYNNGRSQKVECPSSSITLIDDSDGGLNLKEYVAALTNQETKASFSIDHDGEPLDFWYCAYAGFERQILENLTITQILTKYGLTQQEIAETIGTFEFERFGYLLATQIPLLQQRILELVLALRKHTPILIMLDPFQPLNGRWREEFARLILERAKNEEFTVICLSVTLVPSVWQNAQIVSRIDIAQ